MSKTKKIQKWLDQNPFDPFDGCNDLEFSTDNISDILAGNGDQVIDNLIDYNLEWIWECEKCAITNAIDDLGLEVEDPHDLEVFPQWSIDPQRIAQNTSGYIGVKLEIEHDAYAREYEDVEIELEDLGINPHDYRSEWSNIPRSDPLVSIKSLEELWINCAGNSGPYVALLDCSDVLELALSGQLEGTLTLKKGAPVTIYNFWNGGGSVIVPTIRDITVQAKDIYNDGDLRYGIQSCYSLCSSEWDGILEPVEKEV